MRYSMIFVNGKRDFRQDGSTKIGDISEDSLGNCTGKKGFSVSGNERETVRGTDTEVYCSIREKQKTTYEFLYTGVRNSIYAL